MERNTRIRRSQISDIAPSDVTANATNSPVDGQVPTKASGQDKWTWQDLGSGGASTESYTTSFTNSDLSSGILTVTHSLGQKYVAVRIYDNNDNEIIPDEITLTSTSACQVDLSSYGTIAGTWNVVVISSITAVAGSGGKYSTTFVDADLSSAGVLSVNHALNSKYVQIYIYDNNDKYIVPDEIALVDADNLTIDLSSFEPLSGTWNLLILG